jgi:hypothetical protein
MDLRSVRWPVVALAVCITLGVLASAQFVYRRQTVDRPLRAFLGGVPGVTSFTLRHSTGGLSCEVRLGRIEDLQSTYLVIEKGLRRMSKEPVTVTVTDDRTAALADAYHRMHFALQESIYRGTFVQAEQVVAREAGLAGLDRYRLRVDAERVYLQLSAVGGNLYEIIPRAGAASLNDTAGGRGGL